MWWSVACLLEVWNDSCLEIDTFGTVFDAEMGSRKLKEAWVLILTWLFMVHMFWNEVSTYVYFKEIFFFFPVIPVTRIRLHDVHFRI